MIVAHIIFKDGTTDIKTFPSVDQCQNYLNKLPNISGYRVIAKSGRKKKKVIE